MANHVYAKNMIDGMPIESDYILVSHSVKKTVKGKDYIDATLSDRENQIHCNKWDATGKEVLEDGGIVHIIGNANLYNGNMQIKANDMFMVDINSADLEPLIPMAPRAGIDMYNELYDLAQSFKDEDLSKVACYILTEQKDHLLNTPGGKFMHHAMINGLLYHTTCMVEDAAALSKVYPTINAELLETGAMLHDIGKIWEFSLGPTGLVKEYSAEGNLEGHLYIGAQYVSSVCDKLGVNDEKKRMLAHMILSHHGRPEYGAVVRPMFAEALMLNLIDELDSHLEIFLRVEKDAEPGAMTERGYNGIDSVHVYHPTYR